ATGARVATHMVAGASFPTDHPLWLNPQEVPNALRTADVVVSFDWIDLAGTFKGVGGPPAGKIVQVSMDHHVHNGWSMDYMPLPYADVLIAAETDNVVKAWLDALGSRKRAKPAPVPPAPPKFNPKDEGRITMRHLALALREAIGAR